MRIDDFKNALQGGGARGNLFRCRTTFPTAVGVGGFEGAGRAVEFMAKGASIPASTVEPIEVQYRGRTLKIPGDRTFEAWTTTVYNDTNFNIRDSFEGWMNLIKSHSGNVGPTRLSEIFQDCFVDQLDRDGNVLKTYQFVDAYPSGLGAIDLAADSGDVQTFDVTWTYQYWTTDVGGNKRSTTDSGRGASNVVQDILGGLGF